jgi:hypothetical protein
LSSIGSDTIRVVARDIESSRERENLHGRLRC